MDILGLGCAAVDDVLYVDAYPPADAKIRVLRRERHCGGLTAAALIAAAKLGGNCAYAGVLGTDAGSNFVLHAMRRQDIDIGPVIRRISAGAIESVIVVDERRRTRNVFADVSRAVGADRSRPSRAFIESAKVLLVDHFGVPGMIRAARIARRAGIPVVADFESGIAPGFGTLLALVDHLILSAAVAQKLTGAATPAAATARLWHKSRALVAVTCGGGGCYFVHSQQRKPVHLPAFAVRAHDTTGCGDVFHGAYAFALARGMAPENCLRFASAAGALKAKGGGGIRGMPSLTSVQRLLRTV